MQNDELKAEYEKVKNILFKKYGDFSNKMNSDNILECHYPLLKDMTICLMQTACINFYIIDNFKKIPDKTITENIYDIVKIHMATEKLEVLLEFALESIKNIFGND